MSSAKHRLRPVDLDFIAAAERCFTFSHHVHAPAETLFARISADPATWTTWFPGLTAAGYLGPEPYGVGTVRWAEVSGIRYEETLLVWQAPTRWAYRLDACSAELFEALVEDWQVAPAPKDAENSILTWTFAIDPGAALSGLRADDLRAAAEEALTTAVTNLNRELA